MKIKIKINNFRSTKVYMNSLLLWCSTVICSDFVTKLIDHKFPINHHEKYEYLKYLFIDKKTIPYA